MGDHGSVSRTVAHATVWVVYPAQGKNSEMVDAVICQSCCNGLHNQCFNLISPQTGLPRAADVRPNWCTCQHKLPAAQTTPVVPAADQVKAL